MSVNASNCNFGWKAKDFQLLSIDGNMYGLADLKGKKGIIIAFICNHCPYVKAIASRLAYEADELKKIEINTVAIMSNDTKRYPEDSYENMKIFAEKNNFKFPYLYDEDQSAASDYKAVCTPDFFGFNNILQLQYRGRIDSGTMNTKEKIVNRELYKAMKMISQSGKGPIKQYNSVGCSIKWKND